MNAKREKIIGLARECGFLTGSVTLQNGLGTQDFIRPIGSCCLVEIEAFYHAVRNEALEEAAVLAKLNSAEPVAWYDGNKFYADEGSAFMCYANIAELKPVFTHPPAPSGE